MSQRMTLCLLWTQPLIFKIRNSAGEVVLEHRINGSRMADTPVDPPVVLPPGTYYIEQTVDPLAPVNQMVLDEQATIDKILGGGR